MRASASTNPHSRFGISYCRQASSMTSRFLVDGGKYQREKQFKISPSTALDVLVYRLPSVYVSSLLAQSSFPYGMTAMMSS